MRNIRRFVCLIISILCILTACLGVGAVGNTYYIEELMMSIDIPEYMSVSTRSTNPKMTEGIYLEALSSSPDLDIRVIMKQDEKTEEFYNLSLLSSSALEEYKNAILSNSEYSDCTEGEYGGVLFLDFTTYDSVGDITVYGRQSVTIVNGMSIVVMSTSEGDALSSEEIALIREVVSSIKFDKILSNAPKIGFWNIFIPVIIVLAVLVVGFFVFSYFMSKKSIEEKKRRKKEMERKADYDVLTRAENKARKPQNPEGLGGYKTSDAFFEDAFGTDNAESAKADITQKSEASPNTMVNESKRAVKSTGYFFKNLKRELSKNKKNKKKANKSSKAKNKRPQDFDIFNDKI